MTAVLTEQCSVHAQPPSPVDGPPTHTTSVRDHLVEVTGDESAAGLYRAVCTTCGESKTVGPHTLIHFLSYH